VIKNKNSHRTRNSIQGIMRNGKRIEIGKRNRKGTGMRTAAGTQTGTGNRRKGTV
jgi:hypothetical protein